MSQSRLNLVFKGYHAELVITPVQGYYTLPSCHAHLHQPRGMTPGGILFFRCPNPVVSYFSCLFSGSPSPTHKTTQNWGVE